MSPRTAIPPLIPRLMFAWFDPVTVDSWHDSCVWMLRAWALDQLGQQAWDISFSLRKKVYISMRQLTVDSWHDSCVRAKSIYLYEVTFKDHQFIYLASSRELVTHCLFDFWYNWNTCQFNEIVLFPEQADKLSKWIWLLKTNFLVLTFIIIITLKDISVS